MCLCARFLQKVNHLSMMNTGSLLAVYYDRTADNNVSVAFLSPVQNPPRFFNLDLSRNSKRLVPKGFKMLIRVETAVGEGGV